MRSGRRERSRGAALIEAAITMPLVFAIVFGVFEFGLGFRSYLTTSNMATTGVRAAAGYGQELEADQKTVDVIRAAGAATEDEIEYVVLFRATGPDSTPTALCEAGISQLNECNVYKPADWADPVAWPDKFGCSTVQSHLDRFWCPSSRNTTVGASFSSVGYVGVYVKARHDYVTGMFGDGITVTDSVVSRFEPDPGTT